MSEWASWPSNSPVCNASRGRKAQEGRWALQVPKVCRDSKVTRASPACKVYQASRVRRVTLEPMGLRAISGRKDPPDPRGRREMPVREGPRDRRATRVTLARKGRPDPLLTPEVKLRRADVTVSPSPFLVTLADALHPRN